MNILAIDPGVGGGLVVRCYASLRTYAMDVSTVLNIIDCMDAVYLEDPPRFCGTPFPGADASKLWQNIGTIQGICLGRNKQCNMVPPKEWQKHYGFKRAKGETYSQYKSRMCRKAKELYPDLGVTLKTSDAVLLYHYVITQRL